MQLTDSVIQLQQFGSFCHKKLSYYVQNTLNIAHKYMDCFYDNFMILLLCFFWSLKASVTIRCNCFFFKGPVLIWFFPFVFPESKSRVFRTTWGCANDDRIFIFGWTMPLSFPLMFLGMFHTLVRFSPLQVFPQVFASRLLNRCEQYLDFATMTQKAFRGEMRAMIYWCMFLRVLVCRVKRVLRMAKLEENW